MYHPVHVVRFTSFPKYVDRGYFFRNIRHRILLALYNLRYAQAFRNFYIANLIRNIQPVTGDHLEWR